MSGFPRGGGGGGSGTVTSVSSTTTAATVANPTTTPAITIGTLDVIATDGPAAAAVPLNGQKITGLANGSASTDAAAFGQIPTFLPAFTAFSAITASLTAVAGTLYTVNTNAVTVTLPAAPTAGQVVGVERGTSGGTITITANTGQTINGGSSGGSINISSGNDHPGQGVYLIATSSTTWVVFSANGCDAGPAWSFNQSVAFGNIITANGGVQVHTTTHTSSSNTSGSDVWYRCTANSFTVTLSHQYSGQMVLVTNEGTGTITVAASSGSVVGPTSLPPSSGAIYLDDGTNWRCVGSYGIGSNTANSATASTPTLGAAAQLAQTTSDAMLYISVGTAGTLTVAIGPTSGVANTIVAGLAAAVGDLYTIRLPAGWYIAVTTSTTAAWTTTAITC